MKEAVARQQVVTCTFNNVVCGFVRSVEVLLAKMMILKYKLKQQLYVCLCEEHSHDGSILHEAKKNC